MSDWNFPWRMTDKVTGATIAHGGGDAVVGQKYILDGKEQNPFRPEDYVVEVLERKQGWVRYRFTTGGEFFQNESMKEDKFMSLYSPLP